MNKMLKGTLAAVIVVLLLLAMASCGGGINPKSLAKQVINTAVEVKKLVENGAESGDPKFDALEKKMEGLSKKIDQLSEADEKIYLEECEKLIKKYGL